MLDNSLLEPLDSLSGVFGIVLEQGCKSVCFNPGRPLVAASVILVYVTADGADPLFDHSNILRNKIIFYQTAFAGVISA